MKTKCLIVICFLFGFCSLVSPVLAVTLTIEQAPSTITDQPFTVDITLSGASAGQNYLRIDLYKEGTSNYFGETSVGSNWYSGSDGVQYVPILIPDAQTVVTATLQGRIGTPSQNDFPGSGVYKIKVRRYTASGSPGDVAQMPADIQINYSLPTPTPTPSLTPTRTPTPTKLPTPTKIPTPTSSSKPTSIIPTSLVGKEGEMPSEYPTSVLGVSSENTSPFPKKDTEVMVKGTSHQSINLIAIILCLGGGLMLSICGILVYLKKRRGEL